MINEQVILQMVNPYLRDNQISYFEFNNLFSMLSEDEKFDVIVFLEENNISIELEDKDALNNEIENDDSLDEEGDEFEETEEQSNTFEILYNNSIFAQNDKADDELAEDRWIDNEKLCVLAQEGNEKALERLCVNNRRLVAKCVNRMNKYPGRNRLDFDDLFQAGMIGLITAVQKFDFSLGNKFSTYATWWIEQKIRREIDDYGSVIRIPVHMIELIKRITKKINSYDTDDIPLKERIKMVAKDLNISEDKVTYCLAIKNTMMSVTSLDIPVGEDEETPFIEMIIDRDYIQSPEEYAADQEMKETIFKAISTLSEREKSVIIYRFGLDGMGPRTLEEIGGIFGVTRERIRQIEAKSLLKLKRKSEPEVRALRKLVELNSSKKTDKNKTDYSKRKGRSK